MIDREKVIRLIEEEISVCESVDQCYRTIDLPALRDILALLKEQEAVEPKEEREDLPEKWASWWYVCGNCGREIDWHDRYCRHCGKSVKWE